VSFFDHPVKGGLAISTLERTFDIKLTDTQFFLWGFLDRDR
jgi:hypothetical protein